MGLRTTVRAWSLRAGVFGHQLPLLDGSTLDLRAHRGSPMLIVNTASKCAFAKQFYGLQTVHERYRDRGLLVLGCPSGDFGGHEFDSSDEIALFCTGLYEITFPLTERMAVRVEPHRFWRDLAGLEHSGPPVWNFTKYLVDGRGAVRGWWSTNVHPESARVVEAVESALAS